MQTGNQVPTLFLFLFLVPFQNYLLICPRPLVVWRKVFLYWLKRVQNPYLTSQVKPLPNLYREQANSKKIFFYQFFPYQRNAWTNRQQVAPCQPQKPLQIA